MGLCLMCAKCGIQITTSCDLGEDTDYKQMVDDREATVKQGLIIFRAGVAEKQIGPKTFSASEPEGYAVNPADVLPSTIFSYGNDPGCCGSAWHGGPNRKCECGQVIGTEWSDCWTHAEVRFLTSAVKLSPVG